MARNDRHSCILSPALHYVKHSSLTPTNQIVGHFATASAWWVTVYTFIVTCIQIQCSIKSLRDLYAGSAPKISAALLTLMISPRG